jgi:hypothetical protein
LGYPPQGMFFRQMSIGMICCSVAPDCFPRRPRAKGIALAFWHTLVTSGGMVGSRSLGSAKRKVKCMSEHYICIEWSNSTNALHPGTYSRNHKVEFCCSFSRSQR